MSIEITIPTKPAATLGYVFNHCMLRVKDIQKSLDFYCGILGFTLVEMREFAEFEFNLYFLALVDNPATLPTDPQQRRQWCKSVPAILELTYNYGTEQQADFHYHNGNSQPRGFGHICLSVPDLVACCERLEQLGVPFQKRIQDGGMKYLAFIRDPDDYWVELIQPSQMPNEPAA